MSQTEIDLDIVIPTQTRYLSLIGNIMEQLAHGLEEYAGDRDFLAYHLNLALTEAIANAIEHAGKDNGHKIVRVSIHVQGKNLCIQVYDQGRGFDLAKVPCPDPEELCERGRGIFFIRTLMDYVDYHRTETGNVLEMRKKLA
jgi:serine/threonine-protein kinase RsbW